MNTHKSLLGALLPAALLVGFSATGLHAQTSVNLVYGNSAGSYTYYARGELTSTATDPGTISPFTTAFYPASGTGLADNTSATWNQSYTSSNAGAISFADGNLSNNNTTDYVAGFQGVISYDAGSTTTTAGRHGYYDLLFNLGSSYVVTSVEIYYEDASGYRWSTGSNNYPTTVWTSETAPTADVDLTEFGTGQKASANTAGSISYTATAVQAQYVDIRAGVFASYSDFSGTNRGGKISEVIINGYAIPEPATCGLLAGLCAIALVGGARRRVRCACDSDC